MALIISGISFAPLVACTAVGASASEPMATPLASSAILVTPTPAAIPILNETDCMEGYHRPDPGMFPTTPPPALPPDHAGHITCLACHSNLKEPDLQITQSRPESTCLLCHVAKSSTK